MDNEDNIGQGDQPSGGADKGTPRETAKASADEDKGLGGGKPGGLKERPKIGNVKRGPAKAGARRVAAKKTGAAKKGAAKGRAKATGTLVEVARAIGGGIGSAVAKVSNLLPGGGSKKGSAGKVGAAKKSGAKKAAAKATSKAGAKKGGAKKASKARGK